MPRSLVVTNIVMVTRIGRLDITGIGRLVIR